MAGELKKGGYVIYLRHMETGVDYADQRRAALADGLRPLVTRVPPAGFNNVVVAQLKPNSWSSLRGG